VPWRPGAIGADDAESLPDEAKAVAERRRCALPTMMLYDIISIH
jgi:hypothetical protein